MGRDLLYACPCKDAGVVVPTSLRTLVRDVDVSMSGVASIRLSLRVSSASLLPLRLLLPLVSRTPGLLATHLALTQATGKRRSGSEDGATF